MIHFSHLATLTSCSIHISQSLTFLRFLLYTSSVRRWRIELWNLEILWLELQQLLWIIFLKFIIRDQILVANIWTYTFFLKVVYYLGLLFLSQSRKIFNSIVCNYQNRFRLLHWNISNFVFLWLLLWFSQP